MRFERNKDFAWAITFTAFLFFLLSAIACSAVTAVPADTPRPVTLANAHLSRAFLGALSTAVKYCALLALIYGITAIITWPPGPPG